MPSDHRSALSWGTRDSGWIWLVGRLPRNLCASPILHVLRAARGSPPRPTTPRWLNTCPDLGISAGVAFNLLGGKSASRLGTRTSFCVVSQSMKPLPPPNGLGWRRAGACGEAGWGRPPGPPCLPSTGRPIHPDASWGGQVVGWYLVQARHLIHRSELGTPTLARVAI